MNKVTLENTLEAGAGCLGTNPIIGGLEFLVLLHRGGGARG